MSSKDEDSDEKIVAEAKKRFARCEERESTARNLWKEDLRFANGDPDNGYQWDVNMAKQRTDDGRPLLTVNKVKQHNRQITNDARQNKPCVRVYPVDDGADKKTAEVFNGVIRHIEANSSADTAYDTAGEFAVDAGLGYWRITTDYADEKSFDQEIYIKAVKNPLNIYLDPDIQEADGSDARFGFVFEDLPLDEFKEQHPDAEEVSCSMGGGDVWLNKDTIRLCEYYKIVEVKDTLCRDANSGETFMLSEVEDKAIAKQIKADPAYKKRPVCKRSVKWYKIAGDKTIEETDWLGKYIPIVRVVGDEVEIDGKVERKGHTRAMKDAQRMYNYNSSAAIEYGALQTKTPIIASAEAIAGHEDYWNKANTQNLPYLPWNAFDEAGQQLPMPQRMVAPAPAQLFLQGMETASNEMKMASGQYDASMGAKSNETSGRAIIARQREGDTATFHFIDNIARSIKFTGKILVDLIPKIYDTARVVRILGEDGSEDTANIDPSVKGAMIEVKHPQTNEIKEIYNLGVGRYDVTVAVGPSYGTKRAEAFEALTEMSSRNPQLMQVAGDLIMRAADFPMAEQLAERLEKTLPPGLKEGDEAEQIPPQVKAHVEQLTQQVQQLDDVVQKMSAELGDKDIESRKLDLENRKLDIEEQKLTAEAAIQTATAGIPMPEFMLRFDAIEQMLLDVMRNAGHIAENPDEPEPPEQMMQPEQPVSTGFFTPEGNQ